MDSEANEMNSSMCNEQRKDPSTKRLNTTEDYACFPGPSSARFTNEADIVKADNSMSLDNSKECKMESRDPCCICLGPLSDETHLSCCPHLFCYLCLTEWIKMKPCCPMCKRPIKTIRHHFKPLSDSSSGENFEEVLVSDLLKQFELEKIERGSTIPMNIERDELVARIRHLQRAVRGSDELTRRFQTMSVPLSPSLVSGRSECVAMINRYQALLDNMNRPRSEVVNDPAFRCLVYERKLRRRPIVDESDRRLSISPQFFKSNMEAQKERLIPFIRRELVAIYENGISIDQLSERVFNLTTRHQINSPQFTALLRRESGDRISVSNAERFAQLLFDFASSGDDLHIFDQNSTYVSESEWRRSHPVFDSRDNDDIQIIQEHLSRVRDMRYLGASFTSQNFAHLHPLAFFRTNSRDLDAHGSGREDNDSVITDSSDERDVIPVSSDPPPQMLQDRVRSNSFRERARMFDRVFGRSMSNAQMALNDNLRTGRNNDTDGGGQESSASGDEDVYIHEACRLARGSHQRNDIDSNSLSVQSETTEELNGSSVLTGSAIDRRASDFHSRTRYQHIAQVPASRLPETLESASSNGSNMAPNNANTTINIDDDAVEGIIDPDEVTIVDERQSNSNQDIPIVTLLSEDEDTSSSTNSASVDSHSFSKNEARQGGLPRETSEPPPVSFSDFEKRNRKRKLRRELRSYIESKRRTEEALLRSQNYKSKQENSGCWFAEFYTYMNQIESIFEQEINSDRSGLQVACSYMDQFLVRYKRLLAEHASDEPSTSGLNSVAINRKELASPASEHEAHHVEERDSHELLSHGTAEDCSNSSEQMNSCTPVSVKSLLDS